MSTQEYNRIAVKISWHERKQINKQTNIPVVSLCSSVKKQEAQNDCMDDNNDIENDKVL